MMSPSNAPAKYTPFATPPISCRFHSATLARNCLSAGLMPSTPAFCAGVSRDAHASPRSSSSRDARSLSFEAILAAARAAALALAVRHPGECSELLLRHPLPSVLEDGAASGATLLAEREAERTRRAALAELRSLRRRSKLEAPRALVLRRAEGELAELSSRPQIREAVRLEIHVHREEIKLIPFSNFWSLIK